MPRSGPTSEAQLDLHRPASISGKLEGSLDIVEPIATGEQRLHVNRSPVDEIDSEAKLLVEAESPAHLDLLGHHRVLGNRDIAAKPELHQHAARPQHLEARADRPLVSGCLEMHVEIALVGAIVAELPGLINDVDGAIGA